MKRRIKPHSLEDKLIANFLRVFVLYPLMVIYYTMISVEWVILQWRRLWTLFSSLPMR